MPAMRAQDGSPLPLAGDMRGNEKLQGFSPVFGLHHYLLLALLWGDWGLALERSDGRWAI